MSGGCGNNKKDTEATIKIPFDSPRYAEIAYRVLSVDQEPRRNFVEKELRLRNDCLEIHFKADQKMPEHTPAPTPHRAVYGYVFYLLMTSIFIMYLMWALLPTKEWGLSYLPDKYFAVVLPMLVLVGVCIFAFFIYPAINMSLTPDTDEMASVIDVDLMLKGSDKKTVNSWQELSDCLNTPEAISLGDLQFIQKCTFCSGSHQLPQSSEQVSALRFMDLKEVNNHLFY